MKVLISINRFMKQIFDKFINWKIHYNVKIFDFFVRFLISELKARIRLIKATQEIIQLFLWSNLHENYAVNAPESDPCF